MPPTQTTVDTEVPQLIKKAYGVLDTSLTSSSDTTLIQITKLLEDLRQIRKEIETLNIGVAIVPSTNLAQRVAQVARQAKKTDTPDPTVALKKTIEEISTRMLAKLDKQNDKAFKDKMLGFLRDFFAELPKDLAKEKATKPKPAPIEEPWTPVIDPDA
jgi:hypothetical protein